MNVAADEREHDELGSGDVHRLRDRGPTRESRLVRPHIRRTFRQLEAFLSRRPVANLLLILRGSAVTRSGGIQAGKGDGLGASALSASAQAGTASGSRARSLKPVPGECSRRATASKWSGVGA
jgi:hypothetical protein